jgi:nucleoprotein TPR
MQEFAKTRELLVAAETSKKHLEQRVEDLSKHLEGNQEKLAVYERRPHAAAGSTTTSSGLANGQQLEGELADLQYVLFFDARACAE